MQRCRPPRSRTKLRAKLCALPTARMRLQDWPGSQLFFNDGRIVVPQKWPGVLGTVLLVLAIEGAFMALVAARLDSPLNIVAFVTGCGSALHAECSATPARANYRRIASSMCNGKAPWWLARLRATLVSAPSAAGPC